MTQKRAVKTSKFGVKLIGGAALVAAIPQIATATIDNTATAYFTYGGTEASTDSNLVQVDVAPAAPDLDITKSVVGRDYTNGAADRWDAGDTITFEFVVTNEGNLTLTNVTPVEVASDVTFDGYAGTGSLSAFTTTDSTTLLPTESATFQATYTLSDNDVLLAITKANAIVNTATSSGVKPDTNPHSDDTEATATTDIGISTDPGTTGGGGGNPGGGNGVVPELDIAKSYVLTDIVADGHTADVADVGETITYTYTVTNTGNVALSNVYISDLHEGATLGADKVKGEALTSEGPLQAISGAESTDDTADDGTWTTLQPGATITFTYVHTVTQTEVDDG